jgi:hypothetical protein
MSKLLIQNLESEGCELCIGTSTTCYFGSTLLQYKASGIKWIKSQENWQAAYNNYGGED